MFVRSVRAAVMSAVLAWAGGAAAFDPNASEIPSELFQDDAESYVADPSESFVVEHSGAVVAAAPAPTRAERCREYLTDGDDPYDGGLACRQPDGSWRIVTGPEAMVADAREPEQREPQRRESQPRPRTYPDYTNDSDLDVPSRATSRRFRLDWGAWSGDRRGNGYRP
jgi:hypothetical protein